MNNQANIYFAEYGGKRMSEANEEKIFNEMLKIYSTDSDINYETLRLMFYFLYEVAITCEECKNGESFYNFLYEKCKDFEFNQPGAWDFCKKYDRYNFVKKAAVMLSSPSFGGPKNWFCCLPPNHKNKEDVIKIFDEELF